MLQDVGNAGAVLGRGTEADINYFIFIIIGKQCKTGSTFFVLQQVAHGVQVFDFFLFYESVACQFFNFHAIMSPTLLPIPDAAVGRIR